MNGRVKGIFWQDIKRSFGNRGFFISISALTALLLTAIVRNSPLDGTRSSYFIIMDAYAISGFAPFAAVFPVLAYASEFCEEYQSGYYRMIFVRIGVKRFGIMRIVSVALSGGVIIAVPIGLVCMVALYCGIPGVPSGSDEGLMAGSAMMRYVAEYGDWYVVLWKVFLGFLFGCVWALVGFAFAVWLSNRYVALIAPFVLYEAMWLGLYEVPVLNPVWLIRGDNLNNYPLSAFMEGVYFCIVSVIILAGLNRRWRNG